MNKQNTLQQAATEFLAHKRIAVAGVSRNRGSAANAIYGKLKSAGYTVFAVNPNAATIDGDPCYPSVATVPGGVDGIVIVTTPKTTERIVRECLEAGVTRVWMHRSFGSSVSEEAVRFCREQGITVIDGACPMMFAEPVDMGHKCIRWVLEVFGKLPKRVPAQD